MRRLLFSPQGWLDYIHWQKSNKVLLKEVDLLTAEICKDPFEGKGNPTQLKFEMNEIWTRRLDLEHRIVYRVTDRTIEVIQCRYHY